MAAANINPVPPLPESGLTDVTNASDREIVFTRVLAAPRELVFKAWTDPAQVAQWWGPRGFSITTHAVDVRPGGVWRYVMHGPDGVDYENRITYVEVVEPERLVYVNGGDPASEPATHTVTATFEPDAAGNTKLTLRMVFPSAAARDFVVKTYGAIEGGRQHVERLAEHVAFALGPVFELERTFDAPRDLVFKAVTEAEHLAHWWGPKGMALTVARFDARPGGTFLYKMAVPNGTEMWGRFVYREIVPPARLVFVNAFSDPDGNVTRAPFFADWPLEVLNVWTFEEAGGTTTLRLRGTPLAATAAERQRFADHRESMRGGFGGTLDQLAAHLAKIGSAVR
jgi:uncharacterized protein YndB with AHSA1/START domain